jgi:hypothetical protein
MVATISLNLTIIAHVDHLLLTPEPVLSFIEIFQTTCKDCDSI